MEQVERVCHAARLGRAQRLSTVLSPSLVEGAPADGFGVGWWPAPEFGRPAAGPSRYRRTGSPRTDAGFLALAAEVGSGCAVAAVRAAPAGAPADESACGPHLVSGVLVSCAVEGADLPAALGRLVPSTALAAVGSVVPGAFVAALVGARLTAGDALPDAVRAAMRLVADRAPEARLSLLAADGTVLVACGTDLVQRTGDGAVLLASSGAEPGGTPLPPRTVVVASLSGVERSAL
ncbi:MAG: egtC [Frankiales bacterium]|nr:egtC [Frankiales bacterium]